MHLLQHGLASAWWWRGRIYFTKQRQFVVGLADQRTSRQAAAIQQPERRGDAEIAVAPDDEVSEAARKPGVDQVARGDRFSHSPRLPNVDATRKLKVYDPWGALSRRGLHTVGMGSKAAHHLKAWRKFRGLSQEALAERIGKSKATIGHLETGRTEMTHSWLLELAPVLDTTPGYILDHDPKDLDGELLRAAAAVARENRDQVLTILHTFKKAG